MTTKQDWQPKCSTKSGSHCKACTESRTGTCCQCKAPVPAIESAPTTGYVRLEKGNDWGTRYLSLPGQALGGAFNTADQKRGIKFHDGQRVHVRWPDGSLTEESIALKEYKTQVMDGGNTTNVSGKEPGFEIVVRGVKLWTPLAELDVLAEDVAPTKVA
jgi:hypothetical protein